MRDHMTENREMERAYEGISPFEFKNELIQLAKDQEKKSARALLDAGRGNPNWTAATPREAFFALGLFAVKESREVWNEGDLAGQPAKHGIAARLRKYIGEHSEQPGVEWLGKFIDYGIEQCGFDPDAWVYELTDAIMGDNYPEPDRMLNYVERIVHDYVLQEMAQSDTSIREFDLFAVEGATAAMCYIFETLHANGLLTTGDRIALMVPIFPPYIEIPQLTQYNFEVIEIRATEMTEQGEHTWQYPDSELEKLTDPSIKALFLVNPSNPPSVAMRPESKQSLVSIVKRHNPTLMIISDDVYGTFVDDYRSLMADLPYHTIGVYSFSKYFGVTGWRLGVISVQRENIFDDLLQQLPIEKKVQLKKRYASLSLHPERLRFIDRLVADSRQVALNHTAGLSTPQQVQMAMFAGFALLDHERNYRKLTKEICRRRKRLLMKGLSLEFREDPYDAAYYTEFDLSEWAFHHYGAGFTEFLTKNYEPIDILLRLARKASIVLLNGGGFHGPNWSIRVSLANLPDDAYAIIGKELHHVLEEYVVVWQGQKQPTS
ncbi:aspartate 4-decarboxylase [Sulfoacidibacillus thermotolerans]|uniref:Aminotransferase n=1 Tax=Sulfoacidibacillus thermotolerans TaxID=1765684 RepID=A0A2U3D698_SULT2|nr:aspartate 4-decarboxylase [Sulfoacidibacillus thermotolerans]PWI56793.1 aspartate 4-decarboxylase [Sulfoacidibacillus thermotolerans]